MPFNNYDSDLQLDLLLDAIEMNPCFEVRGLLTLNRHGYIEVSKLTECTEMFDIINHKEINFTIKP